MTTRLLALFLLLSTASTTRSAEVVLPQGKTAFYADEAIEIAVAGLPKDAAAEVELRPAADAAALEPVKFSVKGDGGTVNHALPPLALAPASYTVRVDGQDTPHKITVVSGVGDSTMLFTQVIGAEEVRATGGNFVVGNADGFGLYTGDGKPERENLRRPGGLAAFDRTTALDLPQVVYHYWTGYVTHKPWGTRKSWGEAAMTEAMRLFNFHTAQRLRKFGRNVHAVGTIDEPGLGWGKTPAGGYATGFADWDEQPWYEQRGWSFTNDPPSRPDADWQKYMRVRNAVIGEQQAQAKRDLEAVWPGVTFGADIYAVHVFGDGADAMNQRANDLCSTHVFLDWGLGRLAAVSSIYIEKSHDPLAPVAHAMNGQLMGGPMPSEVQRDCYRGMANSMLMAGLHSNWWLNWGQISKEHLREVNEPAIRLGPLFKEMRPARHDVAVLWSTTEMYMRGKPIAAKSAHQKGGEPIKLMIATLPENTAVKENHEMEVSLYTVGQNYREQITAAHQSLTRGGYPAHVLHEQIVPGGVLGRYKVLVIVGQTSEPPAEVRKAIDEFQSRGGQVVIDATTTVPFKDAVRTEANFKDPGFRWSPLFTLADKKPSPFKTEKERTYFQTNVFMDEQSRAAVAPMKAAMKQTAAKPVFEAESNDLMFERHVAGEGALYMALNAHEKLPEIKDEEAYRVWNHAPYSAAFKLLGVPEKAAVYRIEGADWKTVTKVANPVEPQKADFAAGEMKLFLVAPREPGGVEVTARQQGNALQVEARLNDLKMPWPLTVTVLATDGKPLHTLHRATGAEGTYTETFPLGGNAPAGAYRVKIESPVANLSAEARADVKPAPAPSTELAGAVRVMDGRAISDFLATRPAVTIAVADAKYQAVADKLWKDLAAKGVDVKVAKEETLWRKARYPRVFDPYIKLFKPEGDEQRPEGMKVEREVKLQIEDDGLITAAGGDGKDLGETWREQPGTLATITGKGYIDYRAADGEEMYEPGCKLYVNDQRQLVRVLAKQTELKATPEAREQWSRPWTSLRGYVGDYNLNPQLPEAYSADDHLILLGDSASSELVAALQASELLQQVADAKYPGPGKSLVSFVWSPFAVERNVILIAGTDEAGIRAGAERVAELAGVR